MNILFVNLELSLRYFTQSRIVQWFVSDLAHRSDIQVIVKKKLAVVMTEHFQFSNTATLDF